MKPKLLCLPEWSMRPVSRMDGCAQIKEAALLDWFDSLRSKMLEMNREDVEENTNIKQLVAQCILVAEGKVLVHQIPVTGGEARLHNKHSIFLGGHIHAGEEDLMSAAMREFGEECDYNHSATVTPFGLVNATTDLVSQVHIGIVFVFEGKRAENPKTSDDGVSQMRFVSWDEAASLKGSMTTWSRLAINPLREVYGV